jgi:hypothetical protein
MVYHSTEETVMADAPTPLNREGLIIALFDRIRGQDSQAVSSRDECINLLREIVDAPASQ